MRHEVATLKQNTARAESSARHEESEASRCHIAQLEATVASLKRDLVDAQSARDAAELRARHASCSTYEAMATGAFDEQERLRAAENRAAACEKQLAGVVAHAAAAERAQAAERASLRSRAAAVELEAARVASGYGEKRAGWVAAIEQLEGDLERANATQAQTAAENEELTRQVRMLTEAAAAAPKPHASHSKAAAAEAATETTNQTAAAPGKDQRPSTNDSDALRDTTAALAATRLALAEAAERAVALAADLAREQRLKVRAQQLADQLAEKLLTTTQRHRTHPAHEAARGPSPTETGGVAQQKNTNPTSSSAAPRHHTTTSFLASQAAQASHSMSSPLEQPLRSTVNVHRTSPPLPRRSPSIDTTAAAIAAAMADTRARLAPTVAPPVPPPATEPAAAPETFFSPKSALKKQRSADLDQNLATGSSNNGSGDGSAGSPNDRSVHFGDDSVFEFHRDDILATAPSSDSPQANSNAGKKQQEVVGGGASAEGASLESTYETAVFSVNEPRTPCAPKAPLPNRNGGAKANNGVVEETTKENAAPAPPQAATAATQGPRPKRPPTEAVTPARRLLESAMPLQPTAKSAGLTTASASAGPHAHRPVKTTATTQTAKQRLKVGLALEHGCLAGKSSAAQRTHALTALSQCDAANLRPVLLLRDDGPQGRPSFRGLYIPTGGRKHNASNSSNNESSKSSMSVLSRVFGNGPEQFSLEDATCFFGWNDVDRRFSRVSGPGPAAFPDAVNNDTPKKGSAATTSGNNNNNNNNYLPTRSNHPSVTNLPPTVVAVGYNPITAKYWRKQHDTSHTQEPTFKIYEPVETARPFV